MSEPREFDPSGGRPHQRGQERFRVFHAEDLRWRSLAAYPPEVRLAILVGDPTEPAPYLMRVKVPAGVKMPPHTHPEDRLYTVLSGVFYIGLGERFDEEKLIAHAPGTVLILPGGQPHFHWAKSGEYVCQISAIGPLGFVYVDPRLDPRRQPESAARS
jgi:quercetin dioxygenase-like cupin family protein